ncbi:chromosome segregation protein SMC [Leucobacter sp. GX24907]
MHLKSLTLRGFKSFAQPTTFQFEPGVTAIVGPNGSGKSNVVDALAWVMGEQGAKTLRGGKMEDVIFAGTSTRGPLGRAEVRLTIDNSDGALPIEYSEVTISRILFRNGSSEYAINGENCRLLDVQELLSDSGLGREMHVIVGQGQLDAVLRATPEDRRGFIEEAAGILKHRRRKERTLRKLAAMETNLTRLNDLAGELRRQLKPLGRQAEVAKQAQTIAAEVRDAKARLLADDVVRLRRELIELSQDESERQAERIVLQEQVEQKQIRIERIEQEQQGEELDAARRTTIALESALSKLRGLYSQTQQRLAFLATQAESPEQVHRVSRATVDEANEEEAQLQAKIPEAEQAWQRAGSATRRAQEALDALDDQLSEQSALVSKHDLRLSQLRGRSEAAAQKRDTVAAEAARRGQALEQTEARTAEASAQLAAFEAELAEAGLETSGSAGASGDVADGSALDASYREAQERQAEAELQRDAVRDQLHGLEQERAGLVARIGALSRSLDDRDATGELLSGDRSDIRGRVAEHMRVADGYEAAVGAALGVFSDALLVDTHDAARAAVRRAREQDLGRLRAVIIEAQSAASAEAPEIEGLTRAVDVLLDAPAGVRGLLARSYLASDSAEAVKGAARLRELLGGEAFTVVTTDGDVLTRYTMTGGSGLAPSRIELTAELEHARSHCEEIEQQIEQGKEALARLRDAVDQSKRETHAAYAELRESDAKQAAAAKEHNRLQVRAEASRAEAERARQALAAVAESEEEAALEADRAARALEEAEAEPRPILDASERDGLYAEVEEARAIEIERRLALETARERARAAAARTVALREQLETEQRAADEAARRAVLRARQVERADRVASALPMIIDSCDRSLSEARVAQQAAEQERARFSQELTLLRSEEAELRKRLQAITERVHGSELKSYERKLQLSSLLERAGSELGLVEEVLVSEYGPRAQSEDPDQHASVSHDRTPDTEESDAEASAERRTDETDPANFTREQQEKRLAKAERRLAELGRINPLALEEFSALEQRHTFLSEQLRDLTKTRADLQSIIDELDGKMQGIFADAFADTQHAFAEIFPVLFPGGSGEVSLSDPEDLLNTGIDMAVKPAGKKVERLSLLSGGERSLAAVAWLIAIFQARPSPFYIVDEVEAALDDANLGRLLQVFERLRENSQLIMITHQKRTMEIADALYGVSMRQDGISAVVGQRIGRSDSEDAANDED